MNTSTLPELEDARIEHMERAVFGRIAADRAKSRARRGRWWAVGGAAAAVIVVAAVIAPAVTSTIAGGSAGTVDSAVMPDGGAPEIAVMPEEYDGGMDASGTSPSGSEAGTAAGAVGRDSREIVSTASATVSVDDVARAAAAITEDAEARGGYVESVSVGADRATADSSDTMIYPGPLPGPGGGWISVRVPADELDAAIEALSEVGEVTSSTVSRTDVTEQAVDLRARIAAAEASVQRLTELMAQAQTTADLIAAETALQERQAALEADRQYLATLEGQVELASLSVQLVPPTTPVEADPAGFLDGVAAGWNGLVATLNGLVIAFGFLLPWLAVLAVVGAVVWMTVRLVRRSRRSAAPPRTTRTEAVDGD